VSRRPAELERWPAPLTDASVDVYHGSTRRFDDPEYDGSRLNLAGWTRPLSGKPTITVVRIAWLASMSPGIVTRLPLQSAEADAADRLLDDQRSLGRRLGWWGTCCGGRSRAGSQ
jgi:hypothetical protein